MTVHTFGPQTTAGQPIVVANEVAFAAAVGQVPGLLPVHKFGTNPDVDTAAPEHVWFNGGTLTWLTAASVMDVVSTSANDDGNPTTNSGAHTITIEGLDSNWDDLSEVVTLNGLTPVTTSGSFIRVNRAFVTTVGTYHGTNEGDITIQVTGGGSVQANIQTGRGQTQKTQYSVPRAHQAFMVRFSIDVDSTKAANLTMFQYQNADDITQPYSGAVRVVHTIPNVTGSSESILRAFPPAFGEKTDIWWEAEVTANNTGVSIDYDLALLAT